MDAPLPHHDIVLRDPPLTLRPMTERDWPLLLRWNRDPSVLVWTDGEGTPPRDLEQTQHLYRSVAATPALCFIIKWQGREIGDCWLQHMNEPRLIDRYLGASLWRIDIAIGEPRYWNRGIGRRAIALLGRYGLDHERADAIFGLVRAENVRSSRAFMAAGFTEHRPTPEGTVELIFQNAPATDRPFSA